MVWPFNTKGDKQSGANSQNLSDSVKGLGARGEKLAAKFLRKQGCKILATNYRCPVGEGDIIILDKSAGELAVVEVKTRSEGQRTAPESAVNAEKQKRLRKIAKYYLDTHKTGELGMRIDVVSITIPTSPGSDPEIRHIPNAF